MSYVIAIQGTGRRIGDASSGVRPLEYDPNPHGLAGTNSGASLSPTFDRYLKEKKEKKENQKVSLGELPPYPNSDDVDTPEPFKEDPNEQTINETEELVTIGEGIADSKGEGWILKLYYKETGKYAVLTGTAGFDSTKGPSSWLYINDVSDKIQVKLPTAPLENGMVKHDHKVIMPKTLRISGMVKREYSEAVDALLKGASAAKSLGVYFSLSSPWKTYSKMYIQSFSSKANNRKYDVYDYTIDLTELLLATDLKDVTSNPDLASNKDKGALSGKGGGL